MIIELNDDLAFKDTREILNQKHKFIGYFPTQCPRN